MSSPGKQEKSSLHTDILQRGSTKIVGARMHRTTGDRVVDWNNLVREHSPRLYGMAWRILGHAQDAEDVVQEVFREAHRRSNGAEVVCWPA